MKKPVILFSLIAAITISASAFQMNKEKDSEQSRPRKYKNGKFVGQSRSIYTDEPYWGIVTITVKKGLIKDIDFIVRDSAKHETFSEKYERHFANIPEYVQQCRNDWKGIQSYPKKLIENQDLSKVDAVTGATWSYNIFKASTQEALKKAVK